MKSANFDRMRSIRKFARCNTRGENTGWRCSRTRAVEEHSALAEAVAGAAVDDAVERMPV